MYEYTYTAYGQVYRFDNLIDGTSTVYEYDPIGRLVHFTEFDSSDMVNEFSSLIYYDEEGKLKDYFFIGAYSNTSGVNDWSTYYYNDYLPDGRLDSFSLAADGDITTKTANATVNFTYDKYNRLTKKSYTYTASSSFTASASYTFTETTAATSSQVATHTGTVNGSSVTSTYTYDDNGYITKIVLSTGAEYRYVYDDLGQLVREDNTVTGKTYIYEYDDAGNITSKKTYTLTAAGVTPSGQPSSVSYGYTDSLGWGDLLTSYDDVTITYDAIGNPLTYYTGSASYTMTWTQGRRLEQMIGNGQSLSFTYNADGIRTSKTVNGITHYYHLAGTQILSEEWTDANEVQHLIIYHYDSNGQPVGMSYRNSTQGANEYESFLFVKNLQGDIIKVLDDEGNLLVSYTYDAWGNPTSTTYSNSGASTAVIYNPFRYRGYYYDSETGLYYLNSRYYNPVIGRFINADSVLLGSLLGGNMFSYCMNNPVMYADPLGYNRNAILDELDLLFNEPDWASSYPSEVLERFLFYATNNYVEYTGLEINQKLDVLEYYYQEWLNYEEKTLGDIIHEVIDGAANGLNDPLMGNLTGSILDGGSKSYLGTTVVYAGSLYADMRDYGQTPSSFGTAFLITTTATLSASMVAGVFGGGVIVGTGVACGFTIIAGIFKEHLCN